MPKQNTTFRSRTNRGYANALSPSKTLHLEDDVLDCQIYLPDEHAAQTLHTSGLATPARWVD